jgi:hypothetical protein
MRVGSVVFGGYRMRDVSKRFDVALRLRQAIAVGNRQRAIHPMWCY